MFLYKAPDYSDSDFLQHTGTAGIGDVAAATFRTTYYEDLPTSKTNNLTREMEKEVQKAYRLAPEIFEEAPAEQTGLHSIHETMTASSWELYVEPKLAELRERFPDSDLRSREDMDSDIAAYAKTLRDQYERVNEMATPWDSFLGNLGGGLGAGMIDPLNILSMPVSFGRTTSETLIGSTLQAFRNQAITGGMFEGMAQPFVWDYKQELDSPYTLNDAITNVVIGGVAEGLLGGVFNIIGKSYQKLTKTHTFTPEQDRLMTAFMELQRIADESGAKTVKELEAHIATLNKIQQDIAMGRTPDMSGIEDTIDAATIKGLQDEIDSSTFRLDELNAKRSELEGTYDPEVHSKQDQLVEFGEQRLSPLDVRRLQEVADQPEGGGLSLEGALDEVKDAQKIEFERQQAKDALANNESANQAVHELRASKREQGDQAKIKDELDALDDQFNEIVEYRDAAKRALEKFVADQKVRHTAEKPAARQRDAAGNTERMAQAVHSVNRLLANMGATGIKVNLHRGNFLDTIADPEQLRMAAKIAKSRVSYVKGDIDQIPADIRATVDNALDKMPAADKERLLTELDTHRHTSWAMVTIKGLVFREIFDGIRDGLDMTHLENHAFFGKKGVSSNQLIKELKKGEKGVARVITIMNLIGNNRKAENDISTSYANCRPSKDCAEHCYAHSGTGGETVQLMRSELTEWLLRNYPDETAEQIAKEYQDMAAYEDGLALRLNDKGDLSEAQLDLIKSLNERDIRVQIFSKRPELLRKVDDFNLKMLSIDNSNFKVARENPDLQIAFVLTDNTTRAMVKEVNDRVAVYLPINNKQEVWSLKRLREQYAGVFDDMRRKICPVEGGGARLGPEGMSYVHVKKKTAEAGEWTCTSCDLYGAAGCYHGKNKSEVARNKRKATNLITTDRDTQGDIDVTVNEVRDHLTKLMNMGAITDEQFDGIFRELYAATRKTQPESFEPPAPKSYPEDAGEFHGETTGGAGDSGRGIIATDRGVRFSVDGRVAEAAINPQTGELHINAGAFTSDDHLMRVLREEIIGHYGLRKTLGEGFDDVMNSIINTAKIGGPLRDNWIALSGVDPVTKKVVNPDAPYHGMKDQVIADEIISKMAREELPASEQIWTKILNVVIKALRAVKLMHKDTITVTELKRMVMKSERDLLEQAVDIAPQIKGLDITATADDYELTAEKVDQVVEAEAEAALKGADEGLEIFDENGNSINYRRSLGESERVLNALDEIEECAR